MRESPSEVRQLIGSWKLKAREVIDAAQEEHDAGLKVIPAVLASGDASDELAGQFEKGSKPPKLVRDLDVAKDAVEALPLSPWMASALKDARFWDRTARVMVENNGISRPVSVMTAGWSALQDPTGASADRVIELAFKLKPKIKRKTDTSGHREEDRKIGLFQMVQGVMGNFETYQGKPAPYFKAIIRNEASRDFNELDEADNNRLGLTPKKSASFDDEQRRKLNTYAKDAGKARIGEADPVGDPEILALGAEERQQQREILATLINENLDGEQRRYAVKVLLDGVERGQALKQVGRAKDSDFHTTVRRKLERLIEKRRA